MPRYDIGKVSTLQPKISARACTSTTSPIGTISLLCFNYINFKRSKSLAALVLGWCYASCNTSNIKVDLIGFWLTCDNLSRQHLHWTSLVCGILSSFVVCASYRYREVDWLINAIIRHEPHTSSSFFLYVKVFYCIFLMLISHNFLYFARVLHVCGWKYRFICFFVIFFFGVGKIRF